MVFLYMLLMFLLFVFDVVMVLVGGVFIMVVIGGVYMKVLVDVFVNLVMINVFGKGVIYVVILNLLVVIKMF